ncbi:hypothetical protein GCM10009765_41970 [Fodinicola feengrottensis]|uniref:PknH-like extracellular domain-containing protein n=1 Tax=Fodinicola feengrottensis TaxID=435914 RepID=A0ABN2HIR7_9ACTN
MTTFAVAATAAVSALVLASTAPAAADPPPLATVPLPLQQVALVNPELPYSASYTLNPVVPFDQAPAGTVPACWHPSRPLGDLDGVYGSGIIEDPLLPDLPYLVESNIVLRYPNAAAASAVAAQWNTDLAGCSAPPARINVHKVTTIQNIPVWAYEQTLPGRTVTGYRQFALVQDDNVLDFLAVQDTVTQAPHPLMPFTTSITAMKQHLAGLI